VTTVPSAENVYVATDPEIPRVVATPEPKTMLRVVHGVLPVPASSQLKNPLGRSAAARARNVGAAAEPVAGPAKTRLADWVERAKDNAGVVVAVATDVVNNGARPPAENDVTVPPPPPPPELSCTHVEVAELQLHKLGVALEMFNSIG
jgi:hypothetical protein